jgi:transposase InsO family protein
VRQHAPAAHWPALIGLRALQPKSYEPKTSDGKANAPSPNLLGGEILDLPDQAWAGDITYIPIAEAWDYLAVVIDLCSLRVVGWEIADNMRSNLVSSALLKGELIQDDSFEDIADARTAIFDYIEAYYNTQRKHSSLGYMKPSQYEKQIKTLALN